MDNSVLRELVFNYNNYMNWKEDAERSAANSPYPSIKAEQYMKVASYNEVMHVLESIAKAMGYKYVPETREELKGLINVKLVSIRG